MSKRGSQRILANGDFGPQSAQNCVSEICLQNKRNFKCALGQLPAQTMTDRSMYCLLGSVEEKKEE